MRKERDISPQDIGHRHQECDEKVTRGVGNLENQKMRKLGNEKMREFGNERMRK